MAFVVVEITELGDHLETWAIFEDKWKAEAQAAEWNGKPYGSRSYYVKERS